MERIYTIDTINKKESEKVMLSGWVDARRDHGKLIFIDLRDKSGIVQIVFSPKSGESADHGSPYWELWKEANRLRPERVIQVEGVVQKRPEAMKNPNLATGEVEIAAEKFTVLSESETPPFDLAGDGYDIGEDHRLTYRYLDLRRPRLAKNLRARHEMLLFARNFLSGHGFIEVETPILTKSTPEGARDYIVPSRLHHGTFYALPQSPQQYKQLLMVAGLEKYFQIARCFRDEDTRGDRQPEFTQIDIEISFVTQEEIMKFIEDFYTRLIKTLYPEKHFTFSPFQRLSYKDVIEKYQSDKPDLRKDKSDISELAFVFVYDFPMFEEKDDGSLGAVHHPFTCPTFDGNHDPYDYNHDRKKAFEMRALLQSGDRAKLLNLKAFQYDLVCNGYEVGGGSIRIHDPFLLQLVFQALGYSEFDLKDKFGHMFEAFSYGVPPHGGIALGFDRFAAIMLGEPNIREVIAFPKTGDGRDLMMGAPAEVDPVQLKELGLKNPTFND